jgi:CBS domain containing-hemolysin-like protein
MDGTGWTIVLTVVLTLLSLFFSLHSIAMRSVPKGTLYEAFRKAGKEDEAEAFSQQSESLYLTCGFIRLVCNAGILLALAHLMADRHYLVTLLTAVVIIEVFALAIPHSWAKHAGPYFLPRTYPLLKGVHWVFKPVLKLFEWHDRFVRRVVGLPATTTDEVKEEQLLSVVEQSKLEGVVDEEEVNMIENVLELDETTAEQIMTPRTDLIALSTDTDLPKITEAIRATGHSRIPVYEGTVDNIVGVLYVKDLLGELGENIGAFDLRQKMRKAYFVPETKPLRDLLHEFKKQKLHIAVVLDEYGGTAGIVTIEDIFEHLVGDIADEYEKVEPEDFRKISDTITEVDARTYIDDVNGRLDIELPDDEDYDTLGGFVFSYLGYIPKTGQAFDYANLRFTIVAAEPRSVRRVRIEKQTPPKEENQ